MAEGSMGDKLLNRLVERAQLWAEIREDESVDDGKIVMRRRKSFLESRREAFEYVYALERTVKELDQKVEARDNELGEVHAELADRMAEIRRLATENQSLLMDKTRLSHEIEQRNRSGEVGEDEIGAKYILRLGIPELTEVFNRTVLGKR